jgi:hypothetical protein
MCLPRQILHKQLWPKFFLRDTNPSGITRLCSCENIYRCFLHRLW